MRKKRKPATALELLLMSPRRFELGPAIRLLGLAKQTDDPLAGGDRARAAVRIRQRIEPTVALHEVDEVRFVKDSRSKGDWYELTTPVLNVVGVTGVTTPDFWRTKTEEELAPLHAVTHRLVAEWYKGWCGKQAARRPDCIAPPYACHGRSAAGLEAYLAKTFRLPIRVQEAIPGWTALAEPDGQIRTIVHDPTRACRLTFGPLSRSTFEHLLPGQALLVDVLRRARAYAGPRPRFQVELILCAQDVRVARFDASLVERGDVYGGGPVQDVSIILPESECAAPERVTQEGSA